MKVAASAGLRKLGPLTLATACYALVYVVWERSGWGSPEIRDLVGNAAFLPLNILSGGLGILAARNSALHPGIRRALFTYGVGSLLVLAGNCVALGYLVRDGLSPAVSWGDLFYLTDGVLLVAALSSFPLPRPSRAEQWRLAMDAAIVLIGSAVGIWYFSVRPTLGLQGTNLEAAVRIAYPAVSLVILFTAITLLLHDSLDGNRAAHLLLVAGVILGVVADLTFELLMVETGSRTAMWTDTVYLLCYLLSVASLERYWLHPVTELRNPGLGAERRRFENLLPYLAILVTYGLLLSATTRPWTEPAGLLAVCAALMTVAVVARLGLTARENTRLLAESAAESRFRSLVQHSSDLLLVVTPSGGIRFASPSLSRVLNQSPVDLAQRNIRDLLDPEDQAGAIPFLQRTSETSGVSTPTEWRFRSPDGGVLHAEMLATNLLGDPSVDGIVLNGRDITERKRLQEELTRQAFHDPLTGLPNRSLFLDRLRHAIVLARRPGREVSVVFLDLDDFKRINDSLGHPEGDRLLVEAASRLRDCVRTSDTIARLGGDEFAVLVEDPATPDGLQILARRLQEALGRPFQVAGHLLAIRASIGMATASPGEKPDEVLRKADLAMYSAKRLGKGRAVSFDSDGCADTRNRLELESALQLAIEENRLDAAFQPIYALASGEIIGVEALVRWADPRMGPLLPEHFIPVAEETGLIVPLGQWVLRAACRQVASWRIAFPHRPLTLAVNMSGRQLYEPDIVTQLRAVLEETGLDPCALVLEITETVLMQQESSILNRLAELKALGLRLAIDDFGTGYSSLGYLRRFPLDVLKIPRPFVEDLGSGPDHAALARAIVGLGETLGLDVIAEGIERAEQHEALMAMGCRFGQGYLFSPPLQPDQLRALLMRSPRVAGSALPAGT